MRILSSGGRALALGLALLAAGCAAADPRHAIGGRPEVERAIAQHYQRYATEENWRCTAPYFEAVTGWAVERASGEEMVVRVRYFYRDWAKTGDDDRGIVIERICEGFAERVFTVDLAAQPPRVLAMTGPRRGA